MVCIGICGDSASGKSVLARALADKLGNTTILECDRYHKWARSNPNWQQFTQLNPVCNYLDLMNGDVQLLKSGETIFRCNYDHRTGTFTVAEKIVPEKNVIVCGLHTFMCPDGLYDLRVFLDTDTDIKHEWKITRDTSDRGYTREQVLKQIEKRTEDYETFVRPLIRKADIIIGLSNANFDHVVDIIIRTCTKN